MRKKRVSRNKETFVQNFKKNRKSRAPYRCSKCGELKAKHFCLAKRKFQQENFHDNNVLLTCHLCKMTFLISDSKSHSCFNNTKPLMAILL